MPLELLAQIFFKQLILSVASLLKDVDFSAEIDPVVSREIKAATSLEEVHAAVAKLRKRVTK